MNMTPNENVSGGKVLLWVKDFNFSEVLEVPRLFKANKPQDRGVPFLFLPLSLRIGHLRLAVHAENDG